MQMYAAASRSLQLHMCDVQSLECPHTWQSVELRAPRLWRTEAATRTPALGSIQSVSPYTKLTGTYERTYC